MSAPAGWINDTYKAIRANPERYARHLFGEPTGGRYRDEIEFAGNHWVVIKGAEAGSWKCWTAVGKGGWLVPQATEYQLALDREGAWVHAAEYYGIRTDGERPKISPQERRRQRELEEARRAAAERAQAKRIAERIGKARAIAAPTEPLDGRLGDRHLVEVRCIPKPAGGWPEAIRWHPGLRAIVAAVTDMAGQLTGTHEIYLDPLGQNIVDRTGSRPRKKKRTHGLRKGYAVRLPARGGAAGFGSPLLLRAEGIETALSAWRATGFETWALLGPLQQQDPPPGRRVVDLRDDDPADSKVEVEYQRALDRWRSRGHRIAVATPWPERRGDKSDFNDILKEGHALDAVRKRIELAELALDGMTIEMPPFAAPTAPVSEVRHHLQQPLKKYLGQRFRDGALPALLLTCESGSGKTEVAVSWLPTTIRSDKALKRAHRVVYFVPRHDLAAEIKRRIEEADRLDDDGNERPAADRLKVATFQGRRDGEENEQGNCDNYPAVKGARAAGAPVAKAACVNGKEHCPVWEACQHGTGFFAQFEPAAAADVLIVAHNYLFEGLPKQLVAGVSLVVIDEDFTAHGDNTVEISRTVLDFAEPNTPVRSNGEPDDAKTVELEQLYRRIARVLDAGNPSPATLAAEGLTRADMRRTRKLSRKRKIEHSMGLAERRAAAKKAAINNRMEDIAALTEALEEIAPDDDGAPQLGLDESAGRVKVEDGTITVYGRRKLIGWLKDLPTVILDAKAKLEQVCRFFPNIEVPEIPRPAAPHQKIHQHVGGFGTHHLPEKIPDLILELRRIIAGRRALVIAPLRVIPALRAGLPEAAFLHHGALTGTDQHGKVEVVIVLGSVFPDPRDSASRASAEAGEVVLPGRIELIPATALMADGTGRGFMQPGYRDPRLQAALEQVRNSALEQAIGRARGINRGPADPVEIHVYSNAVLPFPLGSISRWQRPTQLDRMVAGRVVHSNSADLFRLFPDLFPSAEAASKFVERLGGLAGFEALLKGMLLARYPEDAWAKVIWQPAGQGYRPRASYAPRGAGLWALKDELIAEYGELVSWQINSFTPGRPKSPTALVSIEGRGRVEPVENIFTPGLSDSSPAGLAALPLEIAQPPPRAPPDG
jgi:hypothetical protein